MKTLIITIFTLLTICSIQSQVLAQSSKMEYANRAFEKHYYETAIQLYSKILTKNKKNKTAQINIATCYRKTNNWHDAELWYGKLVHNYRKPKAEFVLHYAMAMQINGKCEEALDWFNKYIKLEPEDPRGLLFKQDCQIEKLESLLEDSIDLYEIKNLKINSDKDDFGAKLTPDGNLIFSKGNIGKNYNWYIPVFEPYKLELFQVKLTPVTTPSTEQPVDFTYSQKLRATKSIAQNDRHSSINYTADEQQVYFMQYDRKECGKNIPNLIPYKVFSAQKQRKQWGYTIPFDYNSDEYTVVHPTTSADGMRIYFSSDMPGGRGGMDIYFCEYIEGIWSNPINMGDSINTVGDEVFPFIHYSTGEFYFSSNGWGGLGGFDILMTYELKKKDWKTPINLAAPINSNRNDYSFYLNNDKKLGFLASDRIGSNGGTDVYMFRRIE
jgi:tetratricopeptide (TPR) repeat protein